MAITLILLKRCASCVALIGSYHYSRQCSDCRGDQRFIEAGASVIKVGIGHGSVCTTRIIAGIGVPHITAIYDCAIEARKHNVPVIIDGWRIKYSGDITKAIAAGASAIMIGSLFEGTEESPGETEIYLGRQYKVHRGMGTGAIRKEAKIVTSKKTRTSLFRKKSKAGFHTRESSRIRSISLIGGLRSGMGYCGTATIDELQNDTSFIRITDAGLRESHPQMAQIPTGSINDYQ